jgi:hypothetical protein
MKKVFTDYVYKEDLLDAVEEWLERVLAPNCQDEALIIEVIET